MFNLILKKETFMSSSVIPNTNQLSTWAAQVKLILNRRIKIQLSLSALDINNDNVTRDNICFKYTEIKCKM